MFEYTKYWVNKVLFSTEQIGEIIKGTNLWPEENMWNDSILFLETSEDTPDPTYFEYWLRNYGSQGILEK